jgi:hypothetical protein
LQHDPRLPDQRGDYFDALNGFCLNNQIAVIGHPVDIIQFSIQRVQFRFSAVELQYTSELFGVFEIGDQSAAERLKIAQPFQTGIRE